MWDSFRDAARAWSRHNAPRLGAALAYYVVLSIAPALLVALAIGGIVLGSQAVRGDLYWQVRGVAGSEIASVVEGLLRSAYRPKTGAVATVLGFATMLVGASGVFVELRDTLNYIWNVPAQNDPGMWGLVRDRFFSFAMVLGTGFLLTASVAVTAVIQAAAGRCGECRSIPIPSGVLALSGFTLSLGVTSFLFALIYRVIPEARVAWRDVVLGGVLTALLFSAGRILIGLYLSKADIGSAYGGAGSLIVLLVWVYYSAQIFLYGAEFTHAWSERRRTNMRDIQDTGRRSAA